MYRNIFHDYDIRGRYPGEINETVFYNLGRAIAQVSKTKKIAIGRDARLSSDTLFLYLAAGLSGSKVKVTDLGRVSTPFGLWYARYFKTDTLVVTASHNPKDQNGLKIFSAKLGAVSKNSGLSKIKARFDKLNMAGPPVLPESIRHAYPKHEPGREYAAFVLRWVKKMPPGKIKIAVDFSHGVSGREFESVLGKLKIDFNTLNEAPNGNFPTHGPNPLEVASQKGIAALMKTKKFGLGAVIDGDGDRILFMDENGRMVDPAYIFSLILDAEPVKIKTAVKTVSVAKVVDTVAGRNKIKLVVSKVGRTNIQRVMEKEKAIMGVEKSGHYFFKDFYYGDSSLFALLAVLKIITLEKKPLSGLLEPYRQYVIFPEISLPFEGRVDRIIGDLKSKYQDGKINQLDGLTVEYPSWRFNLRRSHTENVWRLNLEGKNKDELEKIKADIISVLSAQ